MPIPLFLVAAALSAPLPIDGSLPGTKDYPTEALTKEISAAALVELVITPQGKVASCTLLASSGDAKLANAMCGLVNRRKWTAARSPDGAPVYGVVRTLLRFFIPETAVGDKIGAMSQSPDIEMTVSHLPGNGIRFYDAKVSLLVGRNGSVEACEPRVATTAAQPVLAKLGCEQAKTMRFIVPTITGEPLSAFVIEQKIRFVQQTP